MAIKDKKKDKKTWSNEPSNGSIKNSKLSSKEKTTTDTSSKATSGTSKARGEVNRSSKPKYNTYSKETGEYSYKPKSSTSSKATSSTSKARGEVNRSSKPKYNTSRNAVDRWDDWFGFVRSLRNEGGTGYTGSAAKGVSSTVSKPYSSTPTKADGNSYASEALARAGIIDLGNMTDIESVRQAVSDAAIRKGASGTKGSIEYAKFLAGSRANKADLYRQNLLAGLDALGLSEAERSQILGEANSKADAAKEIYALARARTGDLSAIDELTGDARNEAQRYARMYGYDTIAGDDAERWSRLYGYDTATEYLRQQSPEGAQKMEAAPIEIPDDYDARSLDEDRYVYLFGEKIGGGTVTEGERQEAKRRLETVLGIDNADDVKDWSAISFDPDYLKDLKTLNSEATTYQDVIDRVAQYDNSQIADDILVIRDYYDGNNRSDDEVQRARARVKAATGVDLLNIEGIEGTMPDGATFDMDNYLTFMQAYMQQQNTANRTAAEQLQFDETMQQKYGQYESSSNYSALSQPISLDTVPMNEAEAIHEAIVAIDDPELFDQMADSATGMPTAAQQKYTADTITPEQRKMFNYLWNSGRRDEAMEYLDDIDWSVRKAIAAKTEEVSAELSEGVQGGVGSSLISVLSSPARAFVAPINAARTALGQEIDQYDPIFNVGRASDAIRGNVGQNLDELTNGANLLGWNIGSGIYQGAMSIGDSWMTAPLGAGMGAAVMGLEAADSSMREAMERGRTQGEALRDAAVTAFTEAATEKLPLENLFGDVGNPVKYIISNMLSEMGEEVTSEAVEMIYEGLAYGDDTELGDLRREMALQGYSDSDVSKGVLKEIVGRLRDAGFGGAAGGLVGSAPRGAMTAIGDRTSGRNLQANDAARSMLNFAEKMLPEGEVKSIASEQLQAIDGSGKLSNAKLGRVYRELLGSIDEQTRQVIDDTMLRNVRKQLRSMGEGDTALAEAVTRVVAGDGSAQDADYAMVGANDAARTLATSLTERVDEVRGLIEKADELAEMASKKSVSEKAASSAEKTTDAAVSEALDEDERGWDDLDHDEDGADDFDGAKISQLDAEASEAETSTTSDGEDVSIIGAESVGTDGEMKFKVQTADGQQKTVAASELNIGTNDEASARLAAYAREYGANAESMFNARMEDQDVDEYADAFQRAVEYGSDGRNLDTVSKYSSLSVLSPNQIRIAYEIGRAERITRTDLTQKGMIKKLTASGPVSVGNVDISQIKSVNSLNKHQKRSIVAMRSIAKLLDINVEFFESTADAQGRYSDKQGSWNPNTLTLSLDIHAGSNSTVDFAYAIMHTAGHELTHMIFQFADSKTRNDYQDFVMGRLSQKMSADELDARIEKYLEMPGVKDRDAAIEEIVAEASVEALGNITEDEIESLAHQNRPLLKRIAYNISQWVRGMKKKIANAFKGTEAKNEYAKLLNDQLDELAKKWNYALRVARTEEKYSLDEKGIDFNDTEAKVNPDVDTPEGFAKTSRDSYIWEPRIRRAQEKDEVQPLQGRHIDRRSWDSVRKGGEDTTLFCSEVDEAQVAFSEMAKIMLSDAENTQPGEKLFIWDAAGSLTVTGSKRVTTQLLANLKDATNLTWAQIKNSLQQFADMGSEEKGFPLPENTVANRLIELCLDDALSKGYTTIEGNKIAPWDEYVEAKRSYQGSVSEDASPSAYENAISFEDYVFPNPDVETSSDDGGNPFGYDSLTAKPDMSTVKLTPVAIKDRNAAVDMGTANVNKYADRKDPHGTPMMYIPDLGKYVSVGRKAMAHGLDGKRIAMQAPVIAQIGDILENSIVVNEAVPKKVGVQRSWIMLGVAEDWNGDTVYVRSVINQSTGHVEEVAAFYAALGKKNRVSRNVSAERVGEDSLKPSSNSTISVAEMLENVNGTFDDIISENVAEHLGIERSTSEFSERLMYQMRDPDQISDRELLANVMDSAAGTAAELDFVRRYRSKIDELNQKQAEYEQVRQAIMDARKRKIKKADIAALENKARILGGQLDRMDGQLLKFEAGKPLQAVVKRQRAKLNERARQKQNAALTKQRERMQLQKKEALQRLRDKKNEALIKQRDQLKQEKAERVKAVRAEKNESFAKQKYRKAVEKEFSTLREWVASPTTKAHVPEFLRRPLGDVLTSLDFSSDRSLKGGSATQNDIKFRDALDRLNTALTNLREQQTSALKNMTGGQGGLDSSADMFALTIDLPDGYHESFTNLVQEIKDRLSATQDSNTAPINRMTGTQLKELTKALRTMATSIRQMNRLLANAKYDSAVTAARDTMDELGKMAPKKDSAKATAWVGRFLDWTNTVPYYAFKRFGSGGRAIFDGLMDGWDKLAFNSDRLVKFAENAYTTKEVRSWAKKVNTVKLDSGDTIRMTTAQMMSLYCLSKRAQAVGHLLGGGIRVADIESGSKVIRQAGNHTLTQHDLQNIADSLSARQRQVADELQEFMSTQCSEWGNEVSMKRFGYRMFTEKNYFPIESDPNNLKAVDEKSEGESLFRLLNMSSTKGLKKGANNAVVIHDIFDVFSSHSSDMAKYNALGLQILDAMKWLNYVERTPNKDGSFATKSVQQSLERAYGTDARRYILNLLRDLNGTKEGGRNDAIISKFISNSKVSSVAANLRVYLLQITSMPRAAYAISPKYLSIGLAKALSNPRKATRNAIDKVGIAKWKNMGFYDTNISRNIREMVKHDQSTVDKIREKSMAPAGWADDLTLGVIYSAVEAECAKKYPNVMRGSEVWDKLVNNRVREIVYQTQVVDSTMTRSDIMRGGGLATLTTAFMSEPTLTLNMLADSVYDARMRARRGEGGIKPTRQMARALAAFTVTGVFAALLEAAFDAMRDDDEFESFGEKYVAALIGDITEDDTGWEKFTKVLFSNLGDNLNLFGNIPGVPNAIDILQGYDDTMMSTEFISSMKKGYDAYQSSLEGKGTAYNWIYSALKGLSQAFGLPASNAAREAVSIWNTFFADGLGQKRIQTRANTESDAAEAIMAALKAGDTQRVDQIRQRASLYDMDESKINKKVSKLAEEAYAAGKIDRDTAAKLMTGEASQRASAAKSALNSADYQIATGGLMLGTMGDDYIAGTITEAQAREYLAKYKGLRGDEIDDEIGKWNYEKDTGMTYSQMKTDYLDGMLTDSEVLRYRAEYGGATEESAQSTLDHWKYEADTGLAWSDLEDDYADGIITEAQVRQYLAKYDGRTESEVDDRISTMDYHIATGRSTNAPKYWRIAYAYDNGQDYDAVIEETYQEIMYGGEKQKSWKQARSAIASSLASYYKPEYLPIRDTPEGEAMLEHILDVYVAVGYEREDQRWYIDNNW